MTARSSARIAAANARPRTGNANATRSSNRLAGRPPTTGSLSPIAGITKKPRKQPSRRKELNTDRIAGVLEENEQTSQPAGEPTPPADESASEQRPQAVGERTPLAEVWANEQRLQTASERTPSAGESRHQIASDSAPPAEVPVDEQRLQTANGRTSSAEVVADAKNGMPFERATETSANGSLRCPTQRHDEELRQPDQPMSDGDDEGGDQDGGQGGRETETPADGRVHSPPRRYGDAPIMGRYPSPPNGNWNTRGSQRYRIIPGYNDRDYDSDEYSEDSAVEPDGDPDGLEEDPAPPYDDHAEEQLLKVLFASVTTQRALRRKREELRACQQNIQDAKLMVQGYSSAISQMVPNTEYDWIMHRAIQGKVVQYETETSENQDLEARLNLQIEFLEERASKYARPPQKFPHLSRESQQLRFLSQNDDFWESFGQNEATCRSLMEIDVKLRQSDAEKNTLDEAITRNSKRDLDLAMNGSGPLSAAEEDTAIQDISRAPDLLNKHKELQASKLATEKLQAEQWKHLLSLAETTFVDAKVLTPAKETQEAEGEEGGGDGDDEGGGEAPEQGLPEPNAPLKSDSEVLKDGVRESLHAAKEACLKAREEFEDARKFSNEEISQLPQPATEDVRGAARVQKLARLTRALLIAEEAFNDAKKQARKVGITRPRDRTADFSDDSDDGYAASLLERAVVQSRDRVARVQGWTGLYLDPQDTKTLGVQTFLPLTLQRLRPVRVGEDSFDLTEAEGRTRGRIDAMAAVTKSLRGNDDFPQSDRDTPMIDRDEE